MTIAESSEISAIVQHVQTWPILVRIALARRILELTEEAPSEPGRGYSAKEIKAILKIDQSPADDAKVKQWIDEHRMEKYGA